MMEHSDTSMAQDALRSIPLFAGHDLQKAKISRLGGLTNLVFRLDLDGRSYCLRVPGKGTEEYINRANEERAARGAARAGVSPDVLYFDSRTGLMVTVFLGDTVTMSPQHFKERKGSPARAALAFRRLHRSGAVFPFRFELFSMIDGYLKVLAEKEVDFPAGYHDVLKEAETVRTALAANSLPVVACHCDPLAENFLDTGERMWVVDWEYSGMNDPLWDLGDLSVEAAFDPAQEREMIEAYFGGAPSPAEIGRIVIYKAMCDLLWTLWGLIQHANKNPADDFWSYALNRFRRCRDLMADPAFAAHVDAVRRA
jgi:thiamine kinase-like enzyme